MKKQNNSDILSSLPSLPSLPIKYIPVNNLTRFKTTTYVIDIETKNLIDVLKEIHDVNNYEKEYKRPIKYEGKLYLKSTINNNVFDYDDDLKKIGNWNNIQKKIDFVK